MQEQEASEGKNDGVNVVYNEEEREEGEIDERNESNFVMPGYGAPCSEVKEEAAVGREQERHHLESGRRQLAKKGRRQ